MRIAVHAFDGITMFHLAAPLLVFGEVGRQCLAAGWGPVVWTRDGRGIRTAEGPRIEDVRGPDAVEDADLVVLPSWPIDLPMTDEPLTARIRATRELAMFPLGSVLFPAMPLQLRVFEPRYVEMLSSLLAGTVREFGVVLIERGSEVGGGDMRFGVGTVARIVSVDVAEDSIHVLASGTTRFEVVRWLQDEPFPRAEVLELPAVEFDESTPSKLAEAEALVRGTLARASEFVELPWAADVNLSPDLGERIWQVAGIAPLSPMDQYALLRSTSADELLSRLVDDTRGAEIVLTAGWGPEGDDGGE